MQQWLDEYLISDELGVRASAYDVLNNFNTDGFISYIAHINTSDLLNRKKVYSGGYKSILLEESRTKYVGVNSFKDIEIYSSKMNLVHKVDRNFIIDCDAHSYDTIPKHSMWIKVANDSTNSLFDALQQFKVTVRYEEPKTPNIFIHGLLLENNGEGYLSGKDGEGNYRVVFSDSMNSIIGGRGTGKSTSLDLINFILTQNFEDENQLFFFSKYKSMFLLISYYSEEYMIRVSLPQTLDEQSLIAVLTDYESNTYSKHRILYNDNKVKRKILRKYLTIYKIENENNDKIRIHQENSKKTLLLNFYDERYSINSLIEKVNNNLFGDFIKGLFFKDTDFNKMKNQIRFRSKQGLIDFLNKKDSMLSDRKMEMEKIIAPYNEIDPNKIRIKYIQKDLDYDSLPQNFKLRKYLINKDYDITVSETNNFLDYVVRKYGIDTFLKSLVNIDNFPKEEIEALESFARIRRDGDLDKIRVTSDNSLQIVSKLMKNIIDNIKIENIRSFLKGQFHNIDNFTVEFNVNAYEGANSKISFKDISVLSLGQKVVTILNLILSHGEFADNLKPIVIDQPEDNLDSRYIYQNLVSQLREIKEKRQVIIATHNSTIVTNSLSEKVISMTSNGENGWVNKEGYTLDYKIKKEILDVLEGGQDSFKHRYGIFERVIKK